MLTCSNPLHRWLQAYACRCTHIPFTPPPSSSPGMPRGLSSGGGGGAIESGSPWVLFIRQILSVKLCKELYFSIQWYLLLRHISRYGPKRRAGKDWAWASTEGMGWCARHGQILPAFVHLLGYSKVLGAITDTIPPCKAQSP